MRVNPFANLSALGGLVGLFIPLFLFAVLQALVASGIALGEHFLTATLVFALMLLELPTVCIGRACGLPIEGGGPAFLLFDLNGLGCTLSFAFWTLAGSLIGGGISIPSRFGSKRSDG